MTRAIAPDREALNISDIAMTTETNALSTAWFASFELNHASRRRHLLSCDARAPRDHAYASVSGSAINIQPAK